MDGLLERRQGLAEGLLSNPEMPQMGPEIGWMEQYLANVGQRLGNLGGMLDPMNWYRAIGSMPRPGTPEARGALGSYDDIYNLVSNVMPIGMMVHHGSPHRWAPEPDFPAGRPRLDKIGTGEGAQAYGHGMYFAESPGVAKSYAEGLAGGDKSVLTVKRAGKIIAAGDEIDDVGLEAIKALERGARDAGEFKHNTAYYAKRVTDNPAVQKRIDEWADTTIGYDPLKPQMYSLDLPDEKLPGLLDWDKPLSEQPEAVRKAIGKAADEAAYQLDRPAASLTGEEIYNTIAGRRSSSFGKNQPAASEFFGELGIPGLRYLDAGSRAGSGGTSNFVIWDQSLLDEMGRRMAKAQGLLPEKIPDELPGGLLDTSYRIEHRPMNDAGGAARLHDLTAAFPEDIYGSQALQFYGSGYPPERRVLKLIQGLRGKPDAKVKIYRGVPKDAGDVINAGDWVTLDKKVASEYGEKIIEMEVPAADVTAWGDSLVEFGYWPKQAQAIPDELPGGLLDAPRSYWRGENPGDARRIKTGDDWWDSLLFVANDKKYAEPYGKVISEVRLSPEAKVLKEGTGDFVRIAGRQRKNESLLDFGSRTTKAARDAGYDAVEFKQQGNMGTAIINRGAVLPADELPSFAPAARMEQWRTARANAALPVEQGGLGLGPANTAAERAGAGGYVTPGFHGRNDDFSEFNDHGWAAETPSLANEYANAKAFPSRTPGANVMPLMIREGSVRKVATDTNDMRTMDQLRNVTGVDFPTLKYLDETDEFTNEQMKYKAWEILNSPEFMESSRGQGIDSVRINERMVPTLLALNPANIRSRFAAFDPMRRNEADLLASIAPWLLAGGMGALGAGLLGGGPGFD